MNRHYDGNGREVKRTDEKCRIIQTPEPSEECYWSGNLTYYIRSTVLGGETIGEVNPSGANNIRYVRAGGVIIAHLRVNTVWQNGSSTYDAAYYEHTDASGASFRTTKRQMPANQGDYSDERQAEYDSKNANLGLVSNYNPPTTTLPNDFPPLESESQYYCLESAMINSE